MFVERTVIHMSNENHSSLAAFQYNILKQILYQIEKGQIFTVKK